MLETTGVPTTEQSSAVFPSLERCAKGAVAVIECFQRIPCNPCQTACHRGAIRPFSDINDLPVIDLDRCNGCTLCIFRCPGLAIHVVDGTYSETECLIKLPYEFDLPEKGAAVAAVDRSGAFVCEARVIDIKTADNKTSVISIAVPKGHMHTVRNIVKEYTPPEAFKPYTNDLRDEHSDSIICRCNDITKDGLRQLIAEGFTTVDEIKRVSRLGMGPCQGRNCIPLVMNELSNLTGRPASELHPGTYRPVTRSVPLSAVAKYGEISTIEDGIVLHD